MRSNYFGRTSPQSIRRTQLLPSWMEPTPTPELRGSADTRISRGDPSSGFERTFAPAGMIRAVGLTSSFQAVGKVIHVEHVWGNALRADPDSIVRVFHIQLEEGQPDPEKHAERLQPALVLLGQRVRHGNIRLVRKEAVCARLAERHDWL